MYKRLKKYIALLLCCSVFATSTVYQQKEVKAIAPAIPIVVIGAIALGGGIYFANKDDLQNMASDCMDWLKDNVVDAYNDAVNLVANGGKYIVSGALTSGVYAYLKHKFGWGNADVPVMSVTSDLSVVNASIVELINSCVNAFTQYGFVPSFSVNNWISNNTSHYLTVRSREVSGYDFYYDFHAFNPVVTDIVLKSYSSLWGWDFLLFDSFGNEIAPTDFLQDYMLLGCGVGKNESRNYTGNSSVLRNVVNNYLIDYYGNLTWEERCEKVSSNLLGFPSGIRFWGSEEAYKNNLTDTKDYYGITPGQSINVDIGYNTALQTPDTAVPVQTVGDMTIDDFINATKDIANDDDVAWQDAISKITVNVDVPGTPTVPDNTSILDKILNAVLSIPTAIKSIPSVIDEWQSKIYDKVKAVPSAIGEWGGNIVNEIKTIPSAIGEWGKSIADNIADLKVVIGDWCSPIIDGITGLRVVIGDWGKSIVDSIPSISIPDYTSVLDQIYGQLVSIQDIFLLDTSKIGFDVFVNTLQSRFPIIDQFKDIYIQIKGIEKSDDIPVFYIKMPPQLARFYDDKISLLGVDENLGINNKGEIIFVDLRPYKDLFIFSRVTLEAFIWFWVFRYLFKKFDLTITITP